MIFEQVGCRPLLSQRLFKVVQCLVTLSGKTRDLFFLSSNDGRGAPPNSPNRLCCTGTLLRRRLATPRLDWFTACSGAHRLPGLGGETSKELRYH
jgi:hypothetical protein